VKTDLQVHPDVVAQWAYETILDFERIGVSFENGAITLSGTVPRFIEKHTAESAAQRVASVKGFVEQIRVRMPNDLQKADVEIAFAISTQFQCHMQIPEDKISTTIENWRVNLRGEQ
jgi:osmotically-inducible protein OsmY